MDWPLATAKILIERHEASVCLDARGLAGISLRRDLPWGESVSVMTTSSPAQLANGNFKFAIEMQTGDKIDIEAASFSMSIKPG